MAHCHRSKHQAQSGTTDRQRRKYRSIGAWWLPAAYFVDCYVRRGGFRDGRAGFAYAMVKAIYFWEIGLKLREQNEGPSGGG